MYALYLLLQAVTIGSILYLVLTALIPMLGGFISAEWAKGWAWVQALGGLMGAIIGAVVAAVVGFGFSWLVVHFPMIAPYIPADLHTLTAEMVVGILTGILNALLGPTPVPVAMAKARQAKGMKF